MHRAKRSFTSKHLHNVCALLSCWAKIAQHVAARLERVSKHAGRSVSMHFLSVPYRLRVSQPLGTLRHVEGKHEQDVLAPPQPRPISTRRLSCDGGIGAERISFVTSTSLLYCRTSVSAFSHLTTTTTALEDPPTVALPQASIDPPATENSGRPSLLCIIFLHAPLGRDTSYLDRLRPDKQVPSSKPCFVS